MATGKDLDFIQKKIDNIAGNVGSTSSSPDDLIAKAAAKALSNLSVRYNETVPQLIERLNKDQDPPWVYPKHLDCLFSVFDRIQNGERVKLLLSVPPRHAKSMSVLHGILRFFLTHKNKRVLYICYNHELAEEQSKQLRDRIVKAGLKFTRDSNAIGSWKLSNGCTFRASSIVGGNITGYSADIIIIDDPFKGRDDVESYAVRQKVYDVFQTAVLSRAPQAIIVIHTRWSEDDLIGRLSKVKDADGYPIYEHVNIPAVDDSGNALWPEVRPLAWLEEVKAQYTIYDWSAIFLGRPVPKGASLFDDLPEDNYYDDLPFNVSYSVGIDLAYVKKTHADYSVAVVLATDGKKIYVVDVVRAQCQITEFARHLNILRNKYPRAPFTSYVAGPEFGNIDQLNKSYGLKINAINAKTDKFQRALAVGAAWNNKLIYLPTRESRWKNNFLTEVLHFSGMDDPQDDQVDALVGAYAGVSARRVRRDFSNFF